MKIIYFIITVITFGFSSHSLMGQSKSGQPLDVVAIGKELPRSEVMPFDTKDRALSQSTTSKYFEVISKDWNRQESADYVEYSAKFKRPFLWVDRAVILRLESVSDAYELFVNGEFVGYNQSSMTAAEFDITKRAKTGANNMTVRVFKQATSSKLEARKGDAISIGKVCVVSPPKVRIRDFTVNSSINDMQSGIMELGVILKSQLLNTRNIKLFYELYSPEGELVSNGSRDADFDMRREDTIRFLINVPDVKLWSHETPNLYTILLSTRYEGRFTEYVNVKSGFRTLSIDGDKVSINGNEVKLSIKEYYAAKDSLQLHRDLNQIKSDGYNTIKVKSHPQSSLFYEMCDKIGLYVCNQADINTSGSGSSLEVGGSVSNDPAWESSFVDRVLTMYHSSKNHPSVIMFSMAENSANGYNLYESYLALKELEQIRPIVYIGAKGEWNSDAVDVKGDKANKHDRVVLGEHGKNSANENIITVTAADLTKGEFNVKNNYSLTSIYANATYTVKKGRKIYAEGEIPLNIAPGESASFEIPFGIESKGKKLDVKLSINRVRQVSTDFVLLPVDNDEDKKILIPINIFKHKEIDNSIEELYAYEYEAIAVK